MGPLFQISFHLKLDFRHAASEDERLGVLMGQKKTRSAVYRFGMIYIYFIKNKIPGCTFFKGFIH